MKQIYSHKEVPQKMQIRKFINLLLPFFYATFVVCITAIPLTGQRADATIITPSDMDEGTYFSCNFSLRECPPDNLLFPDMPKNDLAVSVTGSAQKFSLNANAEKRLFSAGTGQNDTRLNAWNPYAIPSIDACSSLNTNQNASNARSLKWPYKNGHLMDLFRLSLQKNTPFLIKSDNSEDSNSTVCGVPIPATFLLVCTGIICIFGYYRKRVNNC